jgi:hypothetical protein
MFSSHEQQVLRDVFEAFDEHGAEYVVLRGYRNLPESTPGGDIDLLIDPEGFRRIDSALMDVDISPRSSNSSNALTLVSEGIRNPIRAARLLFGNPRRLIEISREYLSGTERISPNLKETKYEHGDVILHFTNHLSYQSPMNQSDIRVDPDVEQMMLNRRKRSEPFFVPALPDELAHILCRGIFDYEGSFPSYYKETCSHLVEEIKTDPKADEQFQDILSLLFFDASDIVYDLTINGKYDQIRSSLYRFTDY